MLNRNSVFSRIADTFSLVSTNAEQQNSNGKKKILFFTNLKSHSTNCNDCAVSDENANWIT